MILGMTLPTFTFVHVLISLVGIGSGFVVVYGLLTKRRFDGWTAIFLATTILTDLTGFLFPVEHLLPSDIVGAISLVVLAVALLARYGRHMERSWRWTYVVCAVLALYFNVFVAVVQSFLKIPAIHALAPTQKEPPFLVAQLLLLAIFVVIGTFAVKKFRVELPLSAPAVWKSSKAS
jgi:uncharacterized membrane protein SirB2